MAYGLPVISDRTFTDTESVALDNRRYERCNFAACTVIYNGGPIELIDCIFAPNVRWELRGIAKVTVQALMDAGFDFVHKGLHQPQSIRLKF
jgi:hypothetical protein